METGTKAYLERRLHQFETRRPLVDRSPDLLKQVPDPTRMGPEVRVVPLLPWVIKHEGLLPPRCGELNLRLPGGKANLAWAAPAR